VAETKKTIGKSNEDGSSKQAEKKNNKIQINAHYKKKPVSITAGA